MNETTAKTSYTVGSSVLQPGTKYYWQVHARNACAVGLWSSVFFFTTAPSQTQTYFDDFNRPDSTDVGNGWFNTSGNSPGNLVVKNGALTDAMPTGAAGVYRPFPFTGTLTVSGTVTEMNGYYSLRRYDNMFTILSDGTLFDGYGIEIARGDQNYSDSRVNLIDHGALVSTRYSSFQYGPELNVRITFNLDGSITGTVSDNTAAFDFSFGPRLIESSGANFSWATGGPDDRAAAYTFPTLDNISLILDTGGGELFPTISPDGYVSNFGASGAFYGYAVFPRAYDGNLDLSGASCYGGVNSTFELYDGVFTLENCYANYQVPTPDGDYWVAFALDGSPYLPDYADYYYFRATRQNGQWSLASP